MVTKGDRLGGRDELGVWDVNAVKLGCDDCCTIINIVKLIELKAKKKKKQTKAKNPNKQKDSRFKSKFEFLMGSCPI